VNAIETRCEVWPRVDGGKINKEGERQRDQPLRHARRMFRDSLRTGGFPTPWAHFTGQDCPIGPSEVIRVHPKSSPNVIDLADMNGAR
jgi:hypothetical protein